MRNPSSLGAKKPALRTEKYIAALLLVMLATSSCNRGPSRITQPSISASAAGRQAIEMYDTNGDGMVAGAELDKAPGLKAALPRLDADGDGGVTAEEVAARIKAWQRMGTGLMSFSFTVTLNGTPLPGAKVTFEPEEFLGDEVKAASCSTSSFGSGGATIAKEDRPDPTYPPGMNFGLYRVRISKVVGGKETIPAKYNAETTLGQEVAQDVPEILNNRVVFALTTN